jgi:hypothetical protein
VRQAEYTAQDQTFTAPSHQKIVPHLRKTKTKITDIPFADKKLSLKATLFD